MTKPSFTSAIPLAGVRVERLGRRADHVLGDALPVAGGGTGRVGHAGDEARFQDW